MNAKKAKTLRRALRKMGVNPFETVHNIGPHVMGLTVLKIPYVEFSGQVTLNRTCGRAQYRASKVWAAL